MVWLQREAIGRFRFTLENSTWYLLDVRFDCTVLPPPPRLKMLSWTLITEFDGEFYSWFREEIKTWYPPVQALFQNNETELAKYGGRKLYNMQKTRITLAIGESIPTASPHGCSRRSSRRRGLTVVAMRR